MPLPKPQLRLSTLLVLMLLAGVLFAWYADHRQQVDRQRKLEVEVKMQGAQIADLKRRVKHQSVGAQTWYFWASADDFISSLKHADENRFLEMAPSFARSDDDVFKEGIEQVIELLSSDVLQEKKRAVTAISFMWNKNRERMEPHVDAALAKLIPLLNDPDSGVRVNTVGVIGFFGPRAKPAIPELKKIMMDDNNFNAPYAARSIAMIDSSEDIGPRLIEFVERKHPNWYSAAMELAERAPPDVARKVISKRYEAAENDGERNMAVQALNVIKPE